MNDKKLKTEHIIKMLGIKKKLINFRNNFLVIVLAFLTIAENLISNVHAQKNDACFFQAGPYICQLDSRAQKGEVLVQLTKNAGEKNDEFLYEIKYWTFYHYDQGKPTPNGIATNVIHFSSDQAWKLIENGVSDDWSSGETLQFYLFSNSTCTKEENLFINQKVTYIYQSGKMLIKPYQNMQIHFVDLLHNHFQLQSIPQTQKIWQKQSTRSLPKRADDKNQDAKNKTENYIKLDCLLHKSI